jgi:hypothetical protein
MRVAMVVVLVVAGGQLRLARVLVAPLVAADWGPRRGRACRSGLNAPAPPAVREMQQVGLMLLQQLEAGAIAGASLPSPGSAAAAAAAAAAGPSGSIAAGAGAPGAPHQHQHQNQPPEQQRFKFGFHRPPFRSVDHLHLHCFLLPHQPAAAAVKYCLPLNWVPVGELLRGLDGGAGGGGWGGWWCGAWASKGSGGGGGAAAEGHGGLKGAGLQERRRP